MSTIKLFESSQVRSLWDQEKVTAPDGKMRLTDVADTEQLLRLVQSIPSPKAECTYKRTCKCTFK